jgi:hypothetical protein
MIHGLGSHGCWELPGISCMYGDQHPYRTGGHQRVPTDTATLPRFTASGPRCCNPKRSRQCVVRSALPHGAIAGSRRSPPSTYSSCRCCTATPLAVTCPTCRACGSRRRHTVKPARGSCGASLTVSWSASAAPCSDRPWTTAGGMGIAPASSMARDARCPICLPSRRHLANPQHSGRGAAFPWRTCWACSMPAPGCS